MPRTLFAWIRDPEERVERPQALETAPEPFTLRLRLSEDRLRALQFPGRIANLDRPSWHWTHRIPRNGFWLHEALAPRCEGERKQDIP